MANNEWALLTSLVTASNQQDDTTLYGILADDNVDFSDKPNCLHAAIFAIELEPENVLRHKKALLNFVKKIDGIPTDMKTGIRLEILKDLLAAKKEKNVSNIQNELMKVSPELLAKALEFAAHALNDTRAVKSACKELGMPEAEGCAMVQFFAELGVNGRASMTNMEEMDQAVNVIKSAMPNLK